MPKNPAKIAMMLDPEYDDGGIPLFYTFVLDGLFERILPLLQPNFEACKLLSFLFFSYLFFMENLFFIFSCGFFFFFFFFFLFFYFFLFFSLSTVTLIPGAQEALSDEFFLHSKNELIEAITEYDDAYGPIGALFKSAEYKKCSCTDVKGRRRVCIPPSSGKMCTRAPSVWLR